MKMFGTNGIRGVANGYLCSELALKVGKAIATVLGPGPVAMARDTRVSSPMVSAALSAGLMSMGVDVVDLGMVPTPALQYYVRTHSDVSGGVMVTASHNPPEFNGIKCISADGTECSPEEEAAIEDAYDGDLACTCWDRIGTIRHHDDAGEEYIDAVVSKVDVDAIRSAGLRVCLDCANGAAVSTTPLLLRRLGVRTITINGNPDGFFPGHDSEPTEENLDDLKRMVRELDVDLGIAHDGDADRCVFVTGGGNYVPGDQSLALLGSLMVRANGGGLVVTTVATSSLVEDVVTSAGGTVAYTAVGSPVVARRMMEDSGLFGGEENGGLIFSDHQFCRDGAMAVARMLEAVVRYGPLEDQVSALPRYHTVKGAVMCTDEVKGVITDLIAARHPDLRMNRLDGLRIDYDDGWVLLRPSGTELKYRIYSESRDREVAERRAAEFRAEFEEIASGFGGS
ncbi:MAG: phosphoglucosamine mutase [Candidatus Methanomethylophilaceae archaeon]|nr:phosphoglucosamine mutase [Candidatus Methanomethylophilaceae archaeon]